MARFRYRAVTRAGVAGDGEMEAGSREEVVACLQAAGSIAIRVTEGGHHSLLRLLTADISLRPSVSKIAVVGVIGQMSTLLRAGLPLDRVLEILGEVAGSGGETRLAARLLDNIRRGRSLGDAMAAEPLVSRFCVSLVRAGEASGTLDQALGRAATFLGNAEAVKSKLRNALIYPATVMVACCISLAVLFGFVVPRFKPFFATAKASLPALTRIMLGMGDAVQQYWPAGAAIVLAVSLLVLVLLRDRARRRVWDGWLLKLPMFGDLIRKTEIGQWSEVLGTLLKSGVALETALTIAAETIRNGALKAGALSVTRAVVEGDGLAEPLRRAGLFPVLALRLVRIGEEAARLDDMLLELGAIYARETERQRERLTTLIGPAVTISMGLIVGLVMGSIVTAILGVYRLAV